MAHGNIPRCGGLHEEQRRGVQWCLEEDWSFPFQPHWQTVRQPHRNILGRKQGEKIMSNVMLLYKQVIALSRDDHKNFKLKPVEGFEFAAETHWMPIAGAEFSHAARHYPIVFVGEGDNLRPILLMGLELGHNDYVGKGGAWKRESYLPAFVRRYPFVLADTGAKGKELTVCFDAAFPGWNETEGRELFTADGNNSGFLDEMLQFMNGFNAEMERTAAFVRELSRLNLLEKRSADIKSASGATFKVQDILVVEEQALAKLSGADLETLNKSGFLGWIFAHLMSLGNLTALLDLHLARKAVEKETK